MKHNFMNKENGKVASVLVMYLDDDGHMQTDSYDKVEDLLEDYAAYEQAKPEPLIKDEKIRKAVRAWAEVLEIECCMYDKCINAFAVGTVMINFPGKLRPETLQNGEIYKITELCGEKEE